MPIRRNTFQPAPHSRVTGGLVLAVLGAFLLCALASGSAQAAPRPLTGPTPVLAYYYIWFDAASWERAKIDYPALGRYSSDDRAVMLQHIQSAKQAGLDGFIVSWKSSEVLNRRLGQLVELAEQEDFKLMVIYQGLDFDRNPLPVERVAADLDVFIERYAASRVFDLFQKPVMIWSGTWKFSPQQVAEVTASRRADLLILASEHDLAGFEGLADLVDGNAYYWASVNPETFPGYAARLVEMGAAVHQRQGLWIAPAAPGFDARLVGGTSVVERKDGDTLRAELSAALVSSPDAVGLISWNEFSENSHIEPSVRFGTQYLDIIKEINTLPLAAVGEFDSSEPAGIDPAMEQGGIIPEWLLNTRSIALGGILILALAGFIVILRRRT